MNGDPEQEPQTYNGGSPYEPPADFPSWPDEPGGFNQWKPVEGMFESGEGETPPAIYAAKFKSSTRQAEIFVHDPRNALLGQNANQNWNPGITSEITDLPARITTFVINHDATLAKHIIRATATVDSTSVGITIHKEDDGS